MKTENDGITPEEIAAFEAGVRDGEQLRHNPYSFDDQPRMWEAWETGAGEGRQNRTCRI